MKARQIIKNLREQYDGLTERIAELQVSQRELAEAIAARLSPVGVGEHLIAPVGVPEAGTTFEVIAVRPFSVSVEPVEAARIGYRVVVVRLNGRGQRSRRPNDKRRLAPADLQLWMRTDGGPKGKKK
jgi:hypothetical protein